MVNFPLPRIDTDEVLRNLLLPYSRLSKGEIWEDDLHKHKVGCLDAADKSSIQKLLNNEKAVLAIHDPPYNFVAFEEREVNKFVDWCKLWINNSYYCLAENSSLYIWLGADQNNNFQPFAEFVLMMKQSGFKSRSFITMRNQRGYGTQQNWMSIRQELLYYIKGKPVFNIDAEYTDIPKILKGYYKVVNGKETENFERSKSEFIRAGNVWVDIQQVFYRMEENVNGCYAQKPLKAIDRIILSGSNKNDLIIDFFAHSGATLLSSEINERRCFTMDIDPIYCEISIRRLEHYRNTGKKGWQNSNPFAEEMRNDEKLRDYISDKYSYAIERQNQTIN